jgi:membrane protein YqaA with SNARE-associated domain
MKMNNRNFHAKIKVLNRYYKITRFYDFILNISLKTGVVVGAFLFLLVILDYYFIDTEAILNTLVSKYSAVFVFIVFFTSEALLGLLPPELFIAWSSKAINPWLYVFILGTLSYLGGLLAYYFGQWLFLITSVKNYVERKISSHIGNLRKWGGIFVFAGAMLPVPYSMVSFTSGLINYRFKYYMGWALFRYLRFFIYALIIFKIV